MTRRRLGRSIGQVGIPFGRAFGAALRHNGAQLVVTTSRLPRATELSNFYTSFDGSTEYINGGDIFSFERTQAWSVSFWARKTGGAGLNNQIVGRRQSAGNSRGWAIEVTFGGTVRIFLTHIAGANEIVVPLIGGFSLTDGGWHLGVATYTGNSLASGVTLWWDAVNRTGTPTSNTLGANTIVESTNRFSVGASFDTVNGAARFYSEDIKDVRVFPGVVLNSTEVAELYNNDAMIDNNDYSRKTDCDLWYRMGDGGGAVSYDAGTIQDFSGLGNTGTTVNLTSADVVDGTSAGDWPDRVFVG